MGLQRGEHDLATKQQQQFIYIYIYIWRERNRENSYEEDILLHKYSSTHCRRKADPYRALNAVNIFLKAICIPFYKDSDFDYQMNIDESPPESKQNPSGHLDLSATSYIFKDCYL